MSQLLKTVGTMSAVLGILAGIQSVEAHHSRSMYDHDKIVIVIGAVKEVRWVNPHVSLLVYGATKDGEAPTDWVFEMTSPSILSRFGLPPTLDGESPNPADSPTVRWTQA